MAQVQSWCPLAMGWSRGRMWGMSAGALCHVICAAPSLASDPSQGGQRSAHPTTTGWAIRDQAAFRGPSPNGDRSLRVLTYVSVAFLTGV